jgi:membrane peptidoglycan carboxypeptidase
VHAVLRRFGLATWLIVLCAMAGVLLAGFMVPVAFGVGALADQVNRTANRASADAVAGKIGNGLMPQITTVLDRNGGPLATIFDQYRLPVTYNQISAPMVASIVAIEDRGFFTEAGVDPRSMLRAALHNASGGSTQGASTIDQQYVKNFLINVVDRTDPVAQEADRADTLARKVNEAEVAVQLAQNMSKQDILAGYLNVVEFSDQVYGVGAAAQTYFGTSADKLTVPQAALLAGMVNNPNLYNPYTNPEKSLIRRNVVIDAMAAVGSITPADAATAKATTLGVLPGGPVVPGSTCLGAAPEAGFFCQYAMTYLQQAGFTADQLATGGYTIRTTMDPHASQVIKDAVQHNVPTTQNGVANTFALVQPGNQAHEVLAMVANRNYGTNSARGQTITNIIADPRNVFGAGSSFKIFTTAAALENGTVGFNTPLPNPGADCFMPPNAKRNTRCYPVHNDGNYADPISLQSALATSPNVAFVGLEARTGMPAVVQMAERLGLRHTLASNDAGGAPITDPANPQSKNPQYNQPQSEYFTTLLSFTLGNSPVSTLEMANVSATIMSHGVWCPPMPILSVTDRYGKNVPIAQEPCQQVVSPGVANTLAAGLSQDTISGTSQVAASNAGWHHPDIGKTGTTNESESVAFVGGVDNYAGASMVFADGPRPQEICPGTPVHLGNCGNGAFGGTVAAPPYFAALSQLIAGQPDVPIAGPDPGFMDIGGRDPVVPYVLGQQGQAATGTVQGAGHPVTTQQIYSAAPVGQVVAESPQGNLPPGVPVTLFLSGGPAPTQ